MKISLNWIREYVELDIQPEKLVEGLISIGFDVESIENQAEKLQNFVIGKVLERKKHPNADKLTVCKVDVGGEVLNIVCGAPNVDAGQVVCVARPGAIIPNGEFEIKRTKIRGEFSEGMICSEKEMNLGDDQSGIMVLEDRVPVGGSFAEYLGKDDVVIDFSVAPNRGDLLSHIGVAREVGFLVKSSELKIKSYGNDFYAGNEINKWVSIDIENPKGCYRYCGRVVKNVTVKESPESIKKYITAAGMRPVNNVVDITNFVMLECGQPLHAFDYDLIAEKRIVVKDAKGVKKFKTLDGKERELRDDILLICDGKGPVALAGIMGGENTEIRPETKNVFIESAYFDPVLTRMSSKFLGLQTDSSYRFERGVDIDMVVWACNRAAELISEHCGGEVVKGLIDNYPNKQEKLSVTLRTPQVKRITGLELGKDEIKELLRRIGINSTAEESDAFTFEIPQYRHEDLKREVDLIEEITRLNGYDKIPEFEYDSIYLDTRDYDDRRNGFVTMLREHFTGRGFKEIISNSLISEKAAGLFENDPIRLLNPSSSEMNVLRPNLIAGALETVKNNFNFKARSLKLYEVGDVMKSGNTKDNIVSGIREDAHLLLTLAGDYDVEAVGIPSRPFDIFDLKGEVKVLLEKMNIDNYKLNYYNYSGFYEFCIEYVLRDEILAKLIRVSKDCLKAFDIDRPVICCQFDVNVLFRSTSEVRTYKEVSKFPPVLRDLSVVVDRVIRVSEIEEVINEDTGGLLKKLRLYDMYGLDDKGKLSYTFSLEFSSDERTLTDEEVNKVQDRIVKNLKKTLKAELRK